MKKKYKCRIFKVKKVGLQVNNSSANLSGQEKKDYMKKSTTNLIWSKRPFTLEHKAGKIKS